MTDAPRPERPDLPDGRTDRGRAFYEGARYSAAGIEMALSVLLGYGAGWWVDGKLDSDPWGMIIGICFGFAAGVRSLMQAAKRIERASEAEDRAARARLDGPAPGPAQAPLAPPAPGESTPGRKDDLT